MVAQTSCQVKENLYPKVLFELERQVLEGEIISEEAN
jgi:hypothetical protein